VSCSFYHTNDIFRGAIAEDKYSVKRPLNTNFLRLNMETVNVSEAKSRFSEILSRAAAGERIVIRRRGRPLAAIISIKDLEGLEGARRTTRLLALALGQDPAVLDQIESRQLHPAMAAYGLLKDEEDLSDLADEIYKNRRSQPDRGQSML
jgi:prevent-host-death family protein